MRSGGFPHRSPFALGQYQPVALRGYRLVAVLCRTRTAIPVGHSA
jgi:hypothetical protein